MRFYAKQIGAGLMVLAALPAMGQAGTGGGGGGAIGTRSKCNCTPVQRQPYMAEFKITQVQTLADGTTITRETKELKAEDSQGRIMNANSFYMPINATQTEALQTRVHDPVENTESTWDTRNKTARVTKLPPADQRHGCWMNDSGNYRANYGPVVPPDRPGVAGTGSGGSMTASFGSSSIVGAIESTPLGAVALPVAPGTMPRAAQMTHEDLGTDVIQGVEVRGTRITRTVPVGQIGNDRPIVTIQESWMAPSLGGIILRSVSDSPQTGKRTQEVVSLTVGDPDPSVFQPPEGYKVTVDELHEVACEQRQ